MSHPLPASIVELLRFSGEGGQNLGNRSLLFDRGMDRYRADWIIPPGGKEGFLSDFTREFRSCPSADFREVLGRREQALRALKACSVENIARTRLVVGLGLPHPTETGFLFDRITGAPYLPGSSVKGLLRAAARLAAAGDLPVEGDAWTEVDIRRIFGPELGGGETPRTGSVVFYDAWPTAWPNLEVDILTPHHRSHNDKKGFPSDWDEPNPVPFLTIAAGTTFRFFLGPGDNATFEKDFPRLKQLLQTALDLLGIGAKKAAGYGIFGNEKPAAPVQTNQPIRSAPSKREPLPPPPPPPASSVKEISWPNVELVWHNGSPAASRGSQIAPGSRDTLPVDALEALKRYKKIKADVVVVKIPGDGLRLQRVESWRRQ